MRESNLEEGNQKISADAAEMRWGIDN